MHPEPLLLVLTNLPDEASAHLLAQHLVERRLAACVNVLAPCRSVYRWQGKIEDAQEVPLQIKTTSVCFDQLKEAIIALHPYTLPEIIAMPITQGSADYLAWVYDETHRETHDETSSRRSTDNNDRSTNQ